MKPIKIFAVAAMTLTTAPAMSATTSAPPADPSPELAALSYARPYPELRTCVFHNTDEKASIEAVIVAGEDVSLKYTPDAPDSRGVHLHNVPLDMRKGQAAFLFRDGLMVIQEINRPPRPHRHAFSNAARLTEGMEKHKDTITAFSDFRPVLYNQCTALLTSRDI